MSATRPVLLLVVAFAAGAAGAAALGAHNTGIAFGVGQLTFGIALAAILLKR